MPAREPDGAKVILHIQQHPTLRRIRSPSERIRSRDSGKTEVRKFGGYQSYETEAVETTLSAKGQVKNPAVEDKSSRRISGMENKDESAEKGCCIIKTFLYSVNGGRGTDVCPFIYNEIWIFR